MTIIANDFKQDSTKSYKILTKESLKSTITKKLSTKRSQLFDMLMQRIKNHDTVTKLELLQLCKNLLIPIFFSPPPLFPLFPI